VSARAGAAGLSAMGTLDSSKCGIACCVAMVVGSVAPLSLMDGGVFADIYVFIRARVQAGNAKDRDCRV
jgi:hypothetical protein